MHKIIMAKSMTPKQPHLPGRAIVIAYSIMPDLVLNGYGILVSRLTRFGIQRLWQIGITPDPPRYSSVMAYWYHARPASVLNGYGRLVSRPTRLGTQRLWHIGILPDPPRYSMVMAY